MRLSREGKSKMNLYEIQFQGSCIFTVEAKSNQEARNEFSKMVNVKKVNLEGKGVLY